MSVDLASEIAAAAKVELQGPTALFTRHVSLGKVAEGWRIVSVLGVVAPLQARGNADWVEP